MKAVIGVLLIMLFLTPLLDVPLKWDWGFAGEYDAMRSPFLLAIITLMIFAVTIIIAKKGEIAQRIDPTLKVALVFLLTCAISLIPAINKWDAIRALLPWLCYVFLYWVITTNFVARDVAAGLCPVVIMGTSLLFSIWGISQISEFKVAVGSLGNSNYAGAFLAMTIPLAFSHLLGAGVIQKVFSAATLSISLWCLVYTNSRGAFLGAGAGIFIVFLAYFLRRGKIVSKVLLIVILVAIIFGIAYFAPHIRERLSTITDKSSPTNKVRLDVWRGTWDMTKKTPLLGVGMGNFEALFQPYRFPKEFKLSNPNIASDQLGRVSFVDSTHSNYMQVLAETGFVGLIIFIYLLYVIFRRWLFHLSSSQGYGFGIVAGLGGGIAGFLVSGLTVSLTSLISHSLYFWIYVGIIELVGNEKARFRKRFVGEGFLAIGFCLAIFTGFAAYISFEHSASQFYISEGHKLLWAEYDKKVQELHSDIIPKLHEEAIVELQKARDWDYNNWQAHYDLASVYRKVGKNEDAIAEYNIALSLFPSHVEALNNLASIYAEQSRPGDAEKIYNDAIKIAPSYFLPYKNLGQLYLQLNRKAEARNNFEKVLELEPTLEKEIKPIIDKLEK